MYVYSNSMNIPTNDAHSVGLEKVVYNQTSQVPATSRCSIESLFSKFFFYVEKSFK